MADDRPRESIGADRDAEHPNVSRETRDVRFRPVLMFVLISLAVGSATLFGIWRFYLERMRNAEAVGASSYPLAPRGAPALPPMPRMEQLDRTAGFESEGAELERRDLGKLDRVGQTDQPGFVHIPIEDAMDLVVSKLPVRKNPPEPQQANKSRGLVGAGDANSGRVLREEPR